MTDEEKLKALAGHLSKLPDETLTFYLDMARQEVNLHKIKSSGQRDQLVLYLAAHKATLNVRRAESHSVHDMSKQYASEASGDGLMSTSYGQEYLRLLKVYRPITIRVM